MTFGTAPVVLKTEEPERLALVAALGKLLGDVRPQRCRDLTARSPVEHRLRAAVEEPGCRLDAAQAFNDVVECVGEPSHPDCKPHKSERRQFAIGALQCCLVPTNDRHKYIWDSRFTTGLLSCALVSMTQHW